MKPTYKELELENKKLKRAISPMEDPIFTCALEDKLKKIDLSEKTRMFRGEEYYVLYPAELWAQMYETEPNTHDVTVLGRSLQALLWERSALHGTRVFVKRVEDK